MQHKRMSFDDFKIKKISFSVNDKFKKKKTILINPEIAVASNFDKAKLLITVLLKISLSKGDMPFFFEVVSESKFSFQEVPDKNIIKKLSTINCPAIIFPYVRETIADLTRRSGYPPFHMSPINFVELAKTSQKEAGQADKEVKPKKIS